ncbi:YciI family protein [Humibacter antri]
MKYMLMLRASESVEDLSQGEAERKAMRAYDERLIRAGVLLAGEHLERGSGVLVACDGARRTVADRFRHEPMPVAMWMLQVASRDEAVEWARRCPATDGCIEVRGIVDRFDTNVLRRAIGSAR